MVKYIVPELNVVLISGCFRSSLGYNIVDGFGDEVIKLETKKSFFLQKDYDKN